MAGRRSFNGKAISASIANASATPQLPSYSPSSPPFTAEEAAHSALLDAEAGFSDDEGNLYSSETVATTAKASKKGSNLSKVKSIGRKFKTRIHLGFAVGIDGVKLLETESKTTDEGVRKHLRKLGRRLTRKGVVAPQGRKDFGQQELEQEQEVWLEEEQDRLMGKVVEESEGSWGEMEVELEGELEEELFGGEEEEEDFDPLKMFEDAGFGIASPPRPQKAASSTVNKAAGASKQTKDGAAARTKQHVKDTRGMVTEEKATMAPSVPGTSASNVTANATPTITVEAPAPVTTARETTSTTQKPKLSSAAQPTVIEIHDDDMPASDDTTPVGKQRIPEVETTVVSDEHAIEQQQAETSEDSDDGSDDGNNYFVEDAVLETELAPGTSGIWFSYHHGQIMKTLSKIEWSERDVGFVRLTHPADGSTVVILSGRFYSPEDNVDESINAIEGSNDISPAGGIRGQVYEEMPGYAFEVVAGPKSVAAAVEGLDFVNGTVALMLTSQPTGEVTAALTGIQKGYVQTDELSQSMNVTFDLAHSLDRVQWALSLYLKQPYVPLPQPGQEESEGGNSEGSEVESEDEDEDEMQFDPADFEPEAKETLAEMNRRWAVRPPPQRRGQNKKRKRGDADSDDDDSDSGSDGESSDEEPLAKKPQQQTPKSAAQPKGKGKGVASEFPQAKTGHPAVPPSGPSVAPTEPRKKTAELKRKCDDGDIDTADAPNEQTKPPAKKPRANAKTTTSRKDGEDAATAQGLNAERAPKKKRVYNRKTKAPATVATADGGQAAGVQKPKRKYTRKPKVTADNTEPAVQSGASGNNLDATPSLTSSPNLTNSTNEAASYSTVLSTELVTTTTGGEKRKRATNDEGEDQVSAGVMPQSAQRKKRAPAAKKAKGAA